MPLDIQNLPGLGINSDHRVYSNYFSSNSFVQQVCISQSKNLIIDALRKSFKENDTYTYRHDDYGYPLVESLEGRTLESTDVTKILISDSYRYEMKFFPNIVIRSGGGSYEPISFNQEGTIKYEKSLYEDEYGIQTTLSVPTHRVYAGAWNLSFDVNIYSESRSELDEIIDIVASVLNFSAWNELRANGLFISGIRIGSENAEPYANDYIYSTTISLETRSEWRVEIPLSNIIEKILFYFDSKKTQSNSTLIALPDFKYQDLLDKIEVNL